MKSFKPLQILAFIVVILSCLSIVWVEFHSVNFGENGTVYYAGGASQEEAEKLADYLLQSGVNNADMKLERDGEKKTLLMMFIPKSQPSDSDLYSLARDLEANVFGEQVILAVCDERFHTLYRVNEKALGDLPTFEELSKNL